MTVPSVSPRPSLSLRSPASSTASLDQQLSPQSASSQSRIATAGGGGGGGGVVSNSNARRNRAALRDYYGLGAVGPSPTTGPSGETESASARGSRSSSVEVAPHVGSSIAGRGRGAESTAGAGDDQSLLAELDRDGFDAGSYVRKLLEHEGLKDVLRVERELVAEIRGLDGERKALVYDNYSKLISATDTIRKMRSNMDPLVPATSTLSPAISHIAETASGLANELGTQVDAEKSEKDQQRKLVRWVLGSPARLKNLVDDGEKDEATKEWGVVQGLLDTWKRVDGADDLRKSCQAIMGD